MGLRVLRVLIHTVLFLLDVNVLILGRRRFMCPLLAAKDVVSELPRVPRPAGNLVVGATVGGESSSLQQDGLEIAQEDESLNS